MITCLTLDLRGRSACWGKKEKKKKKSLGIVFSCIVICDIDHQQVQKKEYITLFEKNISEVQVEKKIYVRSTCTLLLQQDFINFPWIWIFNKSF